MSQHSTTKTDLAGRPTALNPELATRPASVVGTMRSPLNDSSPGDRIAALLEVRNKGSTTKARSSLRGNSSFASEDPHTPTRGPIKAQGSFGSVEVVQSASPRPDATARSREDMRRASPRSVCSSISDSTRSQSPRAPRDILADRRQRRSSQGSEAGSDGGASQNLSGFSERDGAESVLSKDTADSLEYSCSMYSTSSKAPTVSTKISAKSRRSSDSRASRVSTSAELQPTKQPLSESPAPGAVAEWLDSMVLAERRGHADGPISSVPTRAKARPRVATPQVGHREGIKEGMSRRASAVVSTSPLMSVEATVHESRVAEWLQSELPVAGSTDTREREPQVQIGVGGTRLNRLGIDVFPDIETAEEAVIEASIASGSLVQRLESFAETTATRPSTATTASSSKAKQLQQSAQHRDDTAVPKPSTANQPRQRPGTPTGGRPESKNTSMAFSTSLTERLDAFEDKMNLDKLASSATPNKNSKPGRPPSPPRSSPKRTAAVVATSKVPDWAAGRCERPGSSAAKDSRGEANTADANKMRMSFLEKQEKAVHDSGQKAETIQTMQTAVQGQSNGANPDGDKLPWTQAVAVQDLRPWTPAMAAGVKNPANSAEVASKLSSANSDWLARFESEGTG